MFNSAEELVKKILEEKMRVESLRKKPRLILIGNLAFNLLEKDWIDYYKTMPWADTLEFEIEQRKNRKQDMFLGDGNLFGLWVVKVDSIDPMSFEIR
jgi:hypothetical protein